MSETSGGWVKAKPLAVPVELHGVCRSVRKARQRE